MIQRGRIALFMSMLLFGLAACGSTPVGSSPTSTQTALAVPTGCPKPTSVVTWPTPPAATIGAHNGASATIQIGQTVEIVLPFGHKWALAQDSIPAALTLATPAGYGDAARQSCVWRFTAQQAGSAQLTYSMGPVCAVGVHCPAYITILTFEITVQG